MYIKNANSEEYAQNLINEFLQGLFIYIAPYNQNILLSENEVKSLTPSDVLDIIKEGDFCTCKTYLCLLKHNNHHTSNIPLIHMIHGVYNYDIFLIEYLNFMIKMFIKYIGYLGESNVSNCFIIGRARKNYKNLKELISTINLRIDGKWYEMSFDKKEDKNDEYDYASHFYIVRFIEEILKLKPNIINLTKNPFNYKGTVYQPESLTYKDQKLTPEQVDQQLKCCRNFSEYVHCLDDLFPKKDNTYYITERNIYILYALATKREDILKPVIDHQTQSISDTNSGDIIKNISYFAQYKDPD